MRKWFVHDSDGREIYLTKERWEHIQIRHGELKNHLDEVLDTVRRGKRRQQPQDPQAFVYRLRCDNLMAFWLSLSSALMHKRITGT